MIKKSLIFVLITTIISINFLPANAAVSPDIVWDIYSGPKIGGVNYQSAVNNGNNVEIVGNDGSIVQLSTNTATFQSTTTSRVFDRDMSIYALASYGSDNIVYMADYIGDSKEKKGGWIINSKSKTFQVGEGALLNSVAVADSGINSGRYVAVGGKVTKDGSESLSYVSVNGNDWSQVNTNNKNGPGKSWMYGCTWGKKEFLAVGDSAGIYRSTDGYDWTAVGEKDQCIKDLKNRNVKLRAITWSGSRYVAVGDADTIITSEDGTRWVYSNYSASRKNESDFKFSDLRSVVWGGNQFVAVGDDSTVLTSFDGMDWFPVNKAIQEKNGDIPLRSVVWDGEKFIIVGYAETIICSVPVRVIARGTRVNFQNQPMVSNGRLLVPVRDVSGIVDAQVDWDAQTRTVTVTKGRTKILITIGNKISNVNGMNTDIGEPAAIVNGRTYVPLRFIGEALSAKVEWLADTRVVKID